MTPNPNDNQPDPGRKLTPVIAGVIAVLVIGIIVAFFLNGAPKKDERDGIVTDPNPSSVHLDGGGVPIPTFDAGVAELIDSGMPDPEAVADAMKQVGAAGDGGVADAG